MSNEPQSELNSRIFTAGEFEAFYRDLYQPISRYVARRIPPSSHDEVVAAVFVVAWQKFANVKSPSLPWLYRIASYEVSHELRRLRRQALVGELNDLHLVDTAPMDQVFDVSRAFSQLSESDAELLRLVYWENLSRSEIAEALGLSVNAVNVRYHRAFERISSAISRTTSSGMANSTTNQSPQENQ